LGWGRTTKKTAAGGGATYKSNLEFNQGKEGTTGGGESALYRGGGLGGRPPVTKKDDRKTISTAKVVPEKKSQRRIKKTIGGTPLGKRSL